MNCIFKAKKNNIHSGGWNLHRSWSNIHPHPKFKTGHSTQPRYTECWLFERAEKESGATESGCTKRQTAGLGKGWACEGKGALVVGHQAKCPIAEGGRLMEPLGLSSLPAIWSWLWTQTSLLSLWSRSSEVLEDLGEQHHFSTWGPEPTLPLFSDFQNSRITCYPFASSSFSPCLSLLCSLTS